MDAVLDAVAAGCHVGIRAGEPPLVNGRDGLRSLEVAQAAIESHRTGKAVPV